MDIRNKLENETNLVELGIPIERFSQDRKINNYDGRLIELCRGFDIHNYVTDGLVNMRILVRKQSKMQV